MKIACQKGEAEIFFSVQGEGKSLGRPSVFARSSLCNLHCVWCDTDYTWNWKGTSLRHNRDGQPGYEKYDKSDQILEMTTQEVAAQVRKYGCRNLIMTGGEPMLHQADWVAVMAHLREHESSFWFEVETNGTIVPTDDFDALVNQYNVSPKLTNSGVNRSLREKSEALTYFAENPKSNFKFVVSSPDDLSEATSIVSAYDIPKRNVYLMPEGTTSEAVRERLQWLAEVCKQHGFNLTDRLHIHIWGDKRGV